MTNSTNVLTRFASDLAIPEHFDFAPDHVNVDWIEPHGLQHGMLISSGIDQIDAHKIWSKIEVLRNRKIQRELA